MVDKKYNKKYKFRIIQNRRKNLRSFFNKFFPKKYLSQYKVVDIFFALQELVNYKQLKVITIIN